MKEKRYYCDRALQPTTRRERKGMDIMMIIFIIVVSIISGIIIHGVLNRKYAEEMNSYSESTIEHLYDVADKVVTENGIDISSIPNDVYWYKITYDDGKTTFEYLLDCDKGNEFVSQNKMTIELSRDNTILSISAKYYTIEDYKKDEKVTKTILSCLGGLLTSCVIGVVVLIIGSIAIPISMLHKRYDMKKLK